ncbi:MAG: DUF2075 domain-containing protein [Bacilli bacterium]|nr:DUF2075 domain-containing protein [Bacilli bacterium]
MENPFVLTFGKEPIETIRRNEELSVILDSFSQEIPSNQIFVITGLRGSGKTVLLTSLLKHYENESDWMVEDLNPEVDLAKSLVSKLYHDGVAKSVFVKGELNFSFHGLGVTLNSEGPEMDPETALERMLVYLKRKKKKLLITIDEASNTPYLRRFAHTFQMLVRMDLPIFLVMTGLFENIDKIQNEKDLTFLLRAPKIYLGPLDLKSIARRYQSTLNIDFSKAAELSLFTKGYAYAFQALGYILYREKTTDINDKVLSMFDDYMSSYVYEKIWSSISAKEKEVVKVVAEDGGVLSSEAERKLGMPHNVFCVYRDRLLKKGLIISPARGIVSVGLPRFDAFIEQQSQFE